MLFSARGTTEDGLTPTPVPQFDAGAVAAATEDQSLQRSNPGFHCGVGCFAHGQLTLQIRWAIQSEEPPSAGPFYARLMSFKTKGFSLSLKTPTASDAP